MKKLLPFIVTFLLLSCGGNNPNKNTIYKNDTLFMQGADGEKIPIFTREYKILDNVQPALCIGDARSLPNSFVYCDSFSNTIFIGDLKRVTFVRDSIRGIMLKTLTVGSGYVIDISEGYRPISSSTGVILDTSIADKKYIDSLNKNSK